MVQTDSYGWPRNGSFGIFDGAVGLFQKKKIQMTSHGINMRPERLKFAEFAGDIFTPRFFFTLINFLSEIISDSKSSIFSCHGEHIFCIPFSERRLYFGMCYT